MRKQWIKLFVIIVITLLFLYLFFRGVNWEEVIFYLKGFNKNFLPIIIALLPFHYITRAWKWKYLILSRKRKVKFWNLFSAYVIGFTVTFLLPFRAGEVIRPVYLGQKERISRSFSFGTVVVERIFDLLTVLFLFGIFLLLKPFYKPYFTERKKALSSLTNFSLISLTIGAILLVLILFLYFFQGKSISFITRILKPFPKLSQKAIHISTNFLDGLKFFHSLKNLILYSVFSIIQWLFIGFFSWVVLYSFNIKFPFPLILPYLFLTMVGASIPTPGMIGGFHALSKFGLISLYGVNTNLAIGTTTVLHAIIYVGTILMGFIILWKEGLSFAYVRRLEKRGSK
ncbi:flippase-like domain-containing protein [Candidatus Aminicenantes bacterium AC-335-A11]|jgi:uncharacterized protein (TIRG00374 family)|nr:flippase-like domain-containing protein [SCandidatus Aminicenantes bacterium Aminicenantia_JdfR_composite]MCP2617971.1 flippase-like domain-containing protein [Candidatus Aminicenantes bacterium AC-335-A11]